MAFEGLSEKLNGVFKRLRGKGRISEADVKEAMREVRLALLEADVSYKVVKDFIASVTERAVGGDVLESLTPAQQIIKIVNEELTARGVSLPLEGQATTTPKTRLEAGNQVQVDIFGEAMRGFQNSGPQESRHINKWLADNCFGDYYTRKGLDYKQREMITFCFLAAQGGCEPQLTSHATANLRIGNDKDFLIQVLSQCLPYIGYPRSLNAIACVNRAAEEMKEG